MAPILLCVHLEKHRSGESLRLENQEFEGSLDFGVRKPFLKEMGVERRGD